MDYQIRGPLQLKGLAKTPFIIECLLCPLACNGSIAAKDKGHARQKKRGLGDAKLLNPQKWFHFGAGLLLEQVDKALAGSGINRRVLST